jgi:hypothetical protein
LLDPVLHRSTIVGINGDSYRLKDKHKAGLLAAIANPPAGARGKP